MKYVIYTWAALTIASWLLFSCGASQRQACLVEANAAKKQRAHELCAGLYWAECDERIKEQIREEHRAAMRSCPP